MPATYNEPYVKFYHRHPAYGEYPVVNITHEAALAYCKWLTGKYNSDPKRKFRKTVFKLPSEHEWKLAACDGDAASPKRFPVPFGGMSLRDKNGIPLANYWRLDEGSFYTDSTRKIVYELNGEPDQAETGNVKYACFYMTHVKNFKPTVIGLFNMAGNVAEMLEEPGHTKGGSWASVGGYLRIDGPDEYSGFTKGCPQIGFRVFMQVIEK